MIKILNSADKRLSKMIHEKGVCAYYYSVCDDYTKNYEQTFIVGMQTLFVKFGQVIGRVAVPRVEIVKSRDAIKFLCDDVLDSEILGDVFDELELNKKGNLGKHTITSNSIDMDKTVYSFNLLVSAVVKKYSLPSLEFFKIKKNIEKTNKVKKTEGEKLLDSIHGKKTAVEDENLGFVAGLTTKGEIHTKGIFNRKFSTELCLAIKILTKEVDCKIISVKAKAVCGSTEKKFNFPTGYSTENKIVLPCEDFDGTIEMQVIVCYELNGKRGKVVGCIDNYRLDYCPENL